MNRLAGQSGARGDEEGCFNGALMLLSKFCCCHLSKDIKKQRCEANVDDSNSNGSCNRRAEDNQDLGG